MIEGRAVTLNAERKMHRFERAAFVKEWRGLGWAAAKQAKVPQGLVAVSIVAQPRLPNRQHLNDPGNELPTVKAIVDGIVDARVVADDGPKYVRSLCFHAAVIEPSSRPALLITIREES